MSYMYFNIKSKINIMILDDILNWTRSIWHFSALCLVWIIHAVLVVWIRTLVSKLGHPHFPDVLF